MSTLYPTAWRQGPHGLQYWNGSVWSDSQGTFEGIRVWGICSQFEPTPLRSYRIPGAYYFGIYVMAFWSLTVSFSALGFLILMVVAALIIRRVAVVTERKRYASEMEVANGLALEWSRDAGKRISEAALDLHGWYGGEAAFSMVHSLATPTPFDLYILPVRAAAMGVSAATAKFKERKASKTLNEALPGLLTNYADALGRCMSNDERMRLQQKHLMTSRLLARAHQVGEQ